jgi:hypothetical protein
MERLSCVLKGFLYSFCSFLIVLDDGLDLFDLLICEVKPVDHSPQHHWCLRAFSAGAVGSPPGAFFPCHCEALAPQNHCNQYYHRFVGCGFHFLAPFN